MSQVTISGAISGLDTAGLINQLVQVQTNQQTILKAQQSAVQKRADAYSALVTSLTSLGTQATDLAKTDSWIGATATSSSSSVSAAASGSTSSSLTFSVTGVAAAHTLVSSGTATSTGAVVASGPLTLSTHDGSTSTIGVGSGSLADVVTAINASDSGLTAVAVRTREGEYRLQVRSVSTGDASSFTLDGLDRFDAADATEMNVVTAGADAELTIGSNPGTAYTVTSSTNTFADLVPGLSFTVSKLETGVTVATTVDGSSIADKVATLVDTANGVLTGIASKSTYDITTKTGGPFTGESAVRSLQQNILNTASGMGAPGVTLTRDGKLAFDRTAFLSAFAADPAKVARAFGATSSFSPAPGVTATSATLSNTLTSARAGTYALQVDTPPAAETWQLDPAGGVVASQTIAITRGATTVSWTAGDSDTLDDAAEALNTRLSGAGLGITAAVSGAGLTFTAGAAGSAHAFSVALGDVAGTRLISGAEISGSIDGQAATGLGSVLSLPTGTSDAAGLSIDVSTTPADLAATSGAIGSFTYTPGLAQRLSRLAKDATADSVGALSTAQDGATAEVKRFQTAIDAWDDRLTAYRQTLTRQFTAMETALAKLKSSTSALSSLINSSSSSSSSSSS